VENEHRRPKKVYRTGTNKHAPEQDIGRVDRRLEVLRYLTKGHDLTGSSAIPATHCLRKDNVHETFWMAEDTSDSINLTTFTTVLRGAPPDPAKKVCMIQTHSAYSI
jgi:hypothetical protein